MNPKFKVELLEEVNELFKKLNDTIWDNRTLHNKTKYRLFAFWDKTDKIETIVIPTHGIEKKYPKTPKKEIEKNRVDNETIF